MKAHHFRTTVKWTGDLGSGTSDYRSFARDFEAAGPGKAAGILGSSDPVFRGDAARYNPEELLIVSLSSCHMLWYLHLCAERGITVREYMDEAEGSVALHAGGAGNFSEVVLHPRIRIEESEQTADALTLHERAHEMCLIARSVNFPVRCEPEIIAS